MMSKDFVAIDHGTGKIDLMHLGASNKMKPVEIHHKSDGSITNAPVFCIVMTAPNLTPVYGQISLEMLRCGLLEIGYDIVRVDAKHE